ncbi:DUF2294 family protein [Bacillus lacus]|uniref:DUF2294 family protein n=1 Tax=Metabacillus lacus TaxID=1983721 RepID=A0A7X2LZD6_9BACI|nr:DUF2294 domain-containing protein [Metabacillus lacus]MRX71584.1 DUF2294 family protein [Metabacillus lacus]
MENRTKGNLEAELSRSFTQWEKDYLGRGSVAVKTDILRHMVIVSLRGILTAAEYRLCETREGTLSIKRSRTELVEAASEDVKNIVEKCTGEEVKSFYTDLSTVTGERMMIFTLKDNLEIKL